MDQDSSGSSRQPAHGNWVSVACIIALLVLTAFVVVMMVVGSGYGPPEPPPSPEIVIDTGESVPQDPAERPEAKAEFPTEDEAGDEAEDQPPADQANPSAE